MIKNVLCHQRVRNLVPVCLIFLMFGLSACSHEKVKPWHRAILAQESAQLVPDALENEADEHIYFSKEGAKGGQGVGGGGCGCN